MAHKGFRCAIDSYFVVKPVRKSYIREWTNYEEVSLFEREKKKEKKELEYIISIDRNGYFTSLISVPAITLYLFHLLIDHHCNGELSRLTLYVKLFLLSRL